MAIIAFCDSSPTGWHNDVEFELRLLRAHIKSVENQIVDSIAYYLSEKKEHLIVQEDAGGEYAYTVTEHYGVDDSTYGLDTIFKEYFPDLQRGSALIALFSFFEHQLDDLCTRFSDEGKVAVKFKDFPRNRDKGINRSTKYLKEEVGLSRIIDTPIWEEIRNIQKVRNAIAHAGNQLRDEDIIEYAQGHGLISGENYVVIKEDYLPHVIETFASYFKEVHKLASLRFCLCESRNDFTLSADTLLPSRFHY